MIMILQQLCNLITTRCVVEGLLQNYRRIAVMISLKHYLKMSAKDRAHVKTLGKFKITAEAKPQFNFFNLI